jgi:hypothetical protein
MMVAHALKHNPASAPHITRIAAKPFLDRPQLDSTLFIKPP